MKYFIANWKANKNFVDVRNWVYAFLKGYKPNKNVTIVICAPAPFLSYLQKKLGNLKNVKIGSQTVSSIEQGSYTGEITAKSLQGVVSHTIIGHSERRKHFNESDTDLAEKVKQAKTYGIEPIYCIRDEKDLIPDELTYIAYEPVWAIGTGQSESIEGVLEMKRKLTLPKHCIFIYGGSVNEKNIKNYLSNSEIDGFLIGGASLDANAFLKICSSC